jgi:MFS family permease
MHSRQDPATTGDQRTRDFWKFWLGQTVSNGGNAITAVAIPILILELTSSPFLLGVARVFDFLPSALFGLVIGAWVDRVDRKRLMIRADIFRAVLIVSIPGLYLLNALPVWWILVVLFLGETAFVAYSAARFAAVPSLVQDEGQLQVANGRLNASNEATGLVGPAIAAVVLNLVAAPILLILDSVSFLASASLIRTVKARFSGSVADGVPGETEAVSEVTRRSFRADVKEGLLFVLRHPVLRALALLSALVNLGIMNATGQIAYLAETSIKATPSEIGLLYAAAAVGGTIASLLAGRLGRTISFGSLVIVMMVINGGAIAALGLVTWFPLAAVLWAVAMGSLSLYNVSAATLRQSASPPEMLGRVVTVAMVLSYSLGTVAAILGGLLIQYVVRVDVAYVVIGGWIVLVALVVGLGPIRSATRRLGVEDADASPAH